MSLLKKTLSSFGIGAAKVDPILQQDVLYPGQTVAIHIHVYGGAHEQQIERIELKLRCRYIAESLSETDADVIPLVQRSTETYTLANWSLQEPFMLSSGEEKNIQAQITVPWNTPVTIGDAKVWLETSLGDSEQSDVQDNQAVTIRPDSLLDGIFGRLEAKGLRLRQAECEAMDGIAFPFVQEFELIPTDGPYHGVVRELEIITYRDQYTLQVWLDVDRPQRGEQTMLAREVEMGNYRTHLTFSNASLPEDAAQQILTVLDQCELEVE
ncbi:sporulation control protein Spo0M [Vibrio sp. CAIM 722]|uniref:Sporulation control protein Spo0M n=1 Tax=Vibrio eleionomae TaxID=2653505 RepID=A0A7X4LKU9_9VIBR|nr:sporulation protein [Vibrio eleionomae]MZI93808.1 sporulation control protein Spo0M [Vibrio eleionomae]